MIDILFSSFLLSVVLVGIHAYFGLEIIQRGIIFTDLAVGQMSALGASVSLMFFHGQGLYPLSLCFALMAGGLIAWVSRQPTIHLEAFIGLLYAFGVSGVFMLLSHSAHGMEEFQELMAADILFTPMSEVLKTAGVYAALGIFIYWFQHHTHGFLKDLLFFITFSITVTSSVEVAGVLVVFALLIAPALLAKQFNRGYPVVNAWLIGIAVNLVGVGISYLWDFPTGYTLVFCHALITLALLLVINLIRQSKATSVVP